MAEPKEPKRPLLGTPDAPLPRLWKAEPDDEPEDRSEAASRRPRKTSPPSVRLDGAGTTKKSRRGQEVQGVGESRRRARNREPKGVLKEETPTFDTYESRQRVRLILGGGL